MLPTKTINGFSNIIFVIVFLFIPIKKRVCPAGHTLADFQCVGRVYYQTNAEAPRTAALSSLICDKASFTSP